MSTQPLTYNAALPVMTRVKITAATSSRVRVAGNTFTHQHARASGSLKDVIYTLDFEG